MFRFTGFVDILWGSFFFGFALVDISLWAYTYATHIWSFELFPVLKRYIFVFYWNKKIASLGKQSAFTTIDEQRKVVYM